MTMETGRKASGLGLAVLLVVGCGGAVEGGQAACEDCDEWIVEEESGGLTACAPRATDRESDLNVEVVERNWDGDRLLRRVDVVTSMGDEYLYETNWSYDEGGRIQGATTTIDGALVGESVWSYNGHRPRKVERSLHGAVVERQIWTYDGNHLVERDVEMAPQGFDDSLEGSAYRDARHTIEHHDTYTLRLYDRHVETMFGESESPWEDANVHRRAHKTDDCYELPASPGHGYPDDEASYHLGLSTNFAETAPQLVYEYGYNGFNPQKWYGHVGVATSWPFELVHPQNRSFRSTMEYDEAGRMVSEELTYSSGDDELVAVTRSRTFDDRGLKSDTVDVGKGDDSAHTEMRFTRDEAGRLLVRERFHDGEIVSYQNWAYEDGTAQRVEIYTSFVFPTAYTPNSGPDALVVDKGELSVEHAATHQR